MGLRREAKAVRLRRGAKAWGLRREAKAVRLRREERQSEARAGTHANGHWAISTRGVVDWMRLVA